MILSFAGLVYLFKTKCRDAAEALAYAIISFCVILYALTEVLSLARMINVYSLWIIWLAIALTLWIYLIKKKNIKLNASDIICYLKKHKLALGLIAVCIAVSIVTIPYNWDSMVYHLGRIVQWKQNSSVGHFATVDIRQLSSPPMAEFINLHVYVMTGTDRLFNLLQTLSYISCAYLIYRLSQRIGNSDRMSLVAAVLFLASPIAFAEAFTTQVDLLTALICMCFIYCLIPYLEYENKLSFDKESVLRTVMLALSIGIGYEAKPSVCIEMAIFFILLLIVCFARKDKFVIVLKHIITAIPIAGLIFVPELIRNYKTFGAISAAEVGERQLVGSIHPKLVLMNFYKTFAFNLPTVLIPKSDVTIYNIGIKLAEVLHIAIDDPRIAEDGREYIVASAPSYGCDVAANPIQVWLMLLGILAILVFIKNINKKDIRFAFILTADFAFLLFCALLRWEPFVSRYMISYLALVVVAIASIPELLKKDGMPLFNENGIIAVYSIIFTLCAFEFWGLCREQATLIKEEYELTESDNEPYFWQHLEPYFEYEEITTYMNTFGADKIGINMGVGAYEYPLYRMLGKTTEVRRILLNNETAIYEPTDFLPDIILFYCVPIDSEQDSFVYNGNEYDAININLRWAVYQKR